MDDLISRQEAIDALEREQSLVERPITETRWFDLGLRKAQDVLSELPSAQPNLQPTCNQLATDCVSRQDAIDDLNGKDPSQIWDTADIEVWINSLPSAERKKGKWIEKHHAYSDEESVIEEWQSCRCSECGRYDTRPYMYYFSEPKFCSWCGAEMRGEQDV